MTLSGEGIPAAPAGIPLRDKDAAAISMVTGDIIFIRTMTRIFINFFFLSTGIGSVPPFMAQKNGDRYLLRKRENISLRI